MALTDKLTAIADAIRGKTGGTEELTLVQMANEIAGISAGGEGYSEQDLVELMAAGNFPSGQITINGGTIWFSAFRDRRNIAKVAAPNAVNLYREAFGNCTELHTVSLPQITNVVSASYAFDGCTKLVNVDMPLIPLVQMGMLRGCSALQGVVFPSATGTGIYAFQNCSGLHTVDLLGGGSIGNLTFQNDAQLRTLILRAPTVTAIGHANVFTGTPFAANGGGGTVYVPAALIDQYRQATNWSTLYTAGTCTFAAIEGSEYE